MTPPIFNKKTLDQISKDIQSLPVDLDQATERLIKLAGDISTIAKLSRTAVDKAHYKQVSELVSSPNSKRWLVLITDILFRTQDTKKVFKRIKTISTKLGIPKFLPLFEKVGISISIKMPALISPLVVRVARIMTRSKFKQVVFTALDRLDLK